jgi:hypothetical protein
VKQQAGFATQCRAGNRFKRVAILDEESRLADDFNFFLEHRKRREEPSAKSEVGDSAPRASVTSTAWAVAHPVIRVDPTSRLHSPVTAWYNTVGMG